MEKCLCSHSLWGWVGTQRVWLPGVAPTHSAMMKVQGRSGQQVSGTVTGAHGACSANDRRSGKGERQREGRRGNRRQE